MMSVLCAIILALFSGLDAGFEYSSFIDHMDTNRGVHDIDGTISYPSSFLNKSGPSGSIDGIAPTDSVNLLTEPMEKEPATILTLNARDHSKLRSNFSYEPPSPPRNVRVSSTGYLNINLQWDLEMDHATSNQYIIEWSSDNSTWNVLIQGYQLTSFAHFSNDLTSGSTFYYRLFTVNSSDEKSQPSNVAQAVAVARSTQGIPTNVVATKISSSSIRASWSAPTNLPTNTGTAGYLVYISENQGSSWTPLNSVASLVMANQFTSSSLDSNTCYGFRLIHAASAGTPILTFSDLSDEAYATTGTVTVPRAPTNLTVTWGGPKTYRLSWTAPNVDKCSPITSYTIQRRDNSSDPWSTVGFKVRDLDESTYTHTSDTNFPITGQYRILARNSAGDGTWSSVVTTVSPPSMPRNLSATASGRTIINLSWDEPSNDGGATISGYRIQWSANGTSNWQDVSPAHTGTGRTYADTGLSPGTTRHYRVYASNSVGESTNPSASDDTTTDSAVPNAPTGLTVAASGRTILTLSWTAPSDDGGTIEGYKIEVSTDGGTNYTDLIVNTGSTQTSYTHRNLTANTTRHYRVSAINSEGTGSASAAAMGTTVDGSTTTVPSDPTSLTATASGRTLIVLSWTAPSNNGGAAVSGYKIEVSSDGGSTWSNLVANSGSTETTYRHRSLAAGSTRHYRVSAINSQGTGSPSMITNATTVAGNVQTIPSDPTGLTATANGPTRIDLSWTTPANNGGTAITGYRIEVSSDGTTGWADVVATTETTGTTYSVMDLLGSTTRYYRVRAINAQGQSLISNITNTTTGAPTAPGVPTSLTATASGQTIINLSWTAPASNGGALISGYRIEVSTDGGTNFSQLVASQSGTTYSHTGLSPGSTRHYRVRAINSVGSSGWSNTANATTGVATFPDAPTELTATDSVQTIINLSWTAPTNTGGAPISDYRILVSADGIDFTTILVSSHTTTRYSHTGLAPGTTRYYRVSAINSAGIRGPESNIAGATTATPTATVPSAPTSLTATPDGQTAIDLSWTAPASNGGATISGYRIEVSTDGGASFSQLVASQSGTTYSHTGLSVGSTRHYRVRAINSVGSSGWSNTANATTGAATVPGVPTSLSATPDGQTAIDLSWTAPASNGGATISGYRIEVSTDGGGEFFAAGGQSERDHLFAYWTECWLNPSLPGACHQLGRQ